MGIVELWLEIMLIADLDQVTGEEDLGLTGDRRLVRSAIIRLQLERLAMRGVNATRAAELVGCHRDTSRGVYRDPRFKKKVLGKINAALGEVDQTIFKEKKDLHARLAEKCEDAFQKLCDLMEDPETSTAHQIKIAQDFLNRNPESQPGATIMKREFDPEQLSRAARVAKEMENVVSINTG